MRELVVILLATTAICARGWFNNRVAMLTIAWYVVEKEGEPPTENELEVCREKVLKKMLRINDESGK